MPLADDIARQTLIELGFRWPTEHPKWSTIVEGVQDRIDDNMIAMRQLAGEDAIPSRRQVAYYEIYSGWGFGSQWAWVRSLMSIYFHWKVRRKYRRYQYWLERGLRRMGELE